MKRLRALLILTSIVISSISSNAQWKKQFTQNELSLSYGYLSCIIINDALGDVEMDDITQSNVETDNRESIGAISLQYLHRSAKKVSYGLAFSFEQTKEDCFTGTKEKTKVGELTNRYYTVTPLLKFNWVEKKKFAFYSKLAIGVTFIGDSYDSTSDVEIDVQSEKQHYFGYQISPVGFTFGRTVCGFVEVGYGSQGVAQAGICYKF